MVKVLPRQIQCRAGLEAQGYSRSGASALVGNLCVESGPNLPSAFRKSNLDHGSNGLPQWRLGRLVAFKAFVQIQKPELVQQAHSTGKNVDDVCWPWYGRMDLQIQFMAHELRYDYPALHAKLVKGGDVAALAADVCWQYERPSKLLSHISDRINYAIAVAADTTTASPVPIAGPSLAVVSITDELHKNANAHATQAQGGAVVAAGGAFAAAALVLSNFVHEIPTWEWVVLLILGLIVILAILGSIQASRNAAAVKAAIPGVDKVPPPPPELPAYAAPLVLDKDAFLGGGPAQQTVVSDPDALARAQADDLAFDQAVEAEVQRRIKLSMMDKLDAGPSTAQTVAIQDSQGNTVAGVAVGSGATMTIKKAGE